MLKVIPVPREVQDRVANHHVEGTVRLIQLLDGAARESLGRKSGGQVSRQSAYLLHGRRGGIATRHVVPRPEKVLQIAARAAARIEETLARSNPPA